MAGRLDNHAGILQGALFGKPVWFKEGDRSELKNRPVGTQKETGRVLSGIFAQFVARIACDFCVFSGLI